MLIMVIPFYLFSQLKLVSFSWFVQNVLYVHFTLIDLTILKLSVRCPFFSYWYSISNSSSFCIPNWFYWPIINGQSTCYYHLVLFFFYEFCWILWMWTELLRKSSRLDQNKELLISKKRKFKGHFLLFFPLKDPF